MTAALASSQGLVAALVLLVLTAAAGWMVTRWVTAYLNRRRVLDHPNERSSHSAPTPRGGGIAILAVALPLAGAVFWLHLPGATMWLAILALTAALAAVSWLDDLRGLPVGVRFAAHIVAVAAALGLLPDNLLVLQGWVPLWLDRLIAGLAWVWFINLFNFMDGIDGLAGAETVAICAGLFAVAAVNADALGASAIAVAQASIVIAGAALGFLVLNWHPARVFMGDVSAIALGYLLGWFLLLLASWGYGAAALILPAYFVADATLTLVRRALAGEAVWQAHATHFYQRAVQRGLSHARVTRFIAAGNCCLIALALASTQVVSRTGDALCLGGAALIVGWMLVWLARAPANPQT
jgi:UDP-N-acetylmuramyl pentapeptide phosphotransferase/UDP-N-acetylglucosamine-1-phosphate transferase